MNFRVAHDLQELVNRLGFGKRLLLPAPPTTPLLADLSEEGKDDFAAFGEIITESEIIDVSRDLYASGHYSLAVQEAFKTIEKFVLGRVGGTTKSATALMEAVFSPSSPQLFWTDRKTQSEKDEQAGYQRIFAGAMIGIRNPTTHEFGWIDDSKTALELLCVAQHLLRKAKLARAEI